MNSHIPGLKNHQKWQSSSAHEISFSKEVLKKYFLNKKYVLNMQFNIYFQTEEATVIANIQIEERQKVKNRELDNLDNLYLKWDKLAPTEE